MSGAVAARPSLIRRGPRRLWERWSVVALGGGAMFLAGTYLTALVYLVARGGARLVSFTAWPTPLSGAHGEVGMRTALAAAIGAAIAWGVVRPLRSLALGRVPVRPRTLTLAGRVAIAAAALVSALLLPNRLPRFLITLPSETTAGGGIGPQLFNTVYTAALSTAVTLPIGIGAAVYLARFARSRALRASVRVALDTLAALPSIVYGLFGFLVFVVELRAGYSLMAGACVLALLNLPLVVGIAEESLRAVPRDLEEASLALGATRVTTVLRVTVPYAWPGILGAVVLSVGRVFAESAPLIMTAGTTISRASAFSLDPMRGGETLAVHLWYVNSSGLSPDRADVSAGTAAMLVVLVTLTNLLAARLGRYGGANGPRMAAITGERRPGRQRSASRR